MAQSKRQLDNLKHGNPDTQICGRDAVEKQKESVKSRARNRKRRKSLGEAAQMVAKLPLNELGKNALKRRGLDLSSVDPEDLNGISALAMGQLLAGINGNSQAAQVFADWLDLEMKHQKDRLEIEKLKAEIERLKAGQDSGDDDMVLQFIEGMKNDREEADK